MLISNPQTQLKVAAYEDLDVVDISAEHKGGPSDGANVLLRCTTYGAMRLYRALGRALFTDQYTTKELVEQ